MTDFTTANFDQIVDLAQDSVVVTVNQRLARNLLQLYGESRLSHGDHAWRQPTIRAWDHWMQDCLWHLDLEDRYLSDFQEQHLWEQVVSENLTDDLVNQLQVPATARMGRDAHHLLIDFACDFSSSHAARDHRAFLAWREQWQKKLHDLDLADRAKIPTVVHAAMVNEQLPVPQRLVLVGFDELRPVQLCLLRGLQEQGCEVLLCSEPARGDIEHLLVEAEDTVDEVQLCARWVRQLLDSDVERIGIVVVDPQRYRLQLERALMTELAPRALLHGETTEGVYSFTLGNVLADEGVVAAALQLLSCGQNLSFDEVSTVLRSPWVGDDEPFSSARMRLEHDLRESGQAGWSLQQLERFAKNRSRGQEKTSVLMDFVSALAASLRRHSGAVAPGRWADLLAKFLSDCGWPGLRTLNSRDYQAREEFSQLFSELSSLERLGRSLSRSEAVAFLKRRCQEKTFQVKEIAARVQVMGLLEAAGLEFDHLWVVGLDDMSFPPAPRPNPFIPVPLQRDRQMPHADSQREYDFSARVAKRLFNSASRVVASFARHEEGMERLASPFLENFSSEMPQLASSRDPGLLIRNQNVLLESYIDSQAPPVVSNKPVSGGTGLVRDQALCPFRAFVHHRLRAQALPAIDIGLNAMQRGSLTHIMLEQFWRKVASSDNLNSLSADEKSALLQQAAEGAVSRIEREQRRDLPDEMRRLEIDRLVRLGLEWLEVEQAREPFKVMELEKTHRCTLGKLEIKTQVDRIDQLSHGGLAIIDYKTGLPDPTRLLDERLSEPQLAVYAHDYDHQLIDAVLFAQVRRGECRFRGLSRHEGEVPRVPGRSVSARLVELDLDFAAVLKRWRRVLPDIANSFVSGEASVLPLEGEKTCRYCDCHSICRIYARLSEIREADNA